MISESVAPADTHKMLSISGHHNVGALVTPQFSRMLCSFRNVIHYLGGWTRWNWRNFQFLACDQLPGIVIHTKEPVRPSTSRTSLCTMVYH